MSLKHEYSKTEHHDLHLQTHRPEPAEPNDCQASSRQMMMRRRPHMSTETRTRSDFHLTHKSFRIETISEGVQHLPQDVPLPFASTHPSLALQNTSAGEIPPQSSLGTTPECSMVGGLLPPHKEIVDQANDRTTELATKSVRERRPSTAWKRTLSGGIFFERSSSSKNASTSSQETMQGHQHVRIISPLKPLRPPIRSALTDQAASTHQVRIETPFTEPGRTDPLPQQTTTRHILSQNTFVNPRDLFPSYINFFRKVTKGKTRNKPAATLQTGSSPFVMGHRTAPKRQNIATALQRVSSLLSEIRHSKPKNQSCSDDSRGSNSSRSVTKGVTEAGHCATQPIPIERVRSMEMVSNSESENSSLVQMRMGSGLPNTPNEQATYRIKRSPSAKTEEFLKIDISIRGGTSYLPSEARRIHTPPLPKEGLDGRQRGFFFDYNIARHRREQSNGGKPTANGSNGRVHNQFQVVVNKTPCSSNQTLHGTKSIDSSSDVNARCDWYGLQLAELDGLGNEEPNLDSPKSAVRSPTLWSKQLNARIEEQMDYTIPEHLPTSPLCPRHPRYWRIVKNRGSQFRGCWMHGVGLWDQDVIS